MFVNATCISLVKKHKCRLLETADCHPAQALHGRLLDGYDKRVPPVSRWDEPVEVILEYSPLHFKGLVRNLLPCLLTSMEMIFIDTGLIQNTLKSRSYPPRTTIPSGIGDLSLTNHSLLCLPNQFITARTPCSYTASTYISVYRSVWT